MQILVTTTDTRPSSDVWEEPDLEEPLKCTGLHHKVGSHGHDPEAPGTYSLIYPCCKRSGVRCEPWIICIRKEKNIHCVYCDKTTPIEQWGFRRL
jgi:hypothetical protein